jgi:hypothetical protein
MGEPEIEVDGFFQRQLACGFEGALEALSNTVCKGCFDPLEIGVGIARSSR